MSDQTNTEAVKAALSEVREGLTRGTHLHHEDEHWISLPYVLDLLERAAARIT